MFPDRRKDLSDRGRDQGCLPWPDIGQKAFRSPEIVPLASDRSIPAKAGSVLYACAYGEAGDSPGTRQEGVEVEIKDKIVN